MTHTAASPSRRTKSSSRPCARRARAGRTSTRCRARSICASTSARRRCRRRSRARLLALADNRITREGVIVIKAQQYRTQDMNRAAALARLDELIRGRQRDAPHAQSRRSRRGRRRSAASRARCGAARSRPGAARWKANSAAGRACRRTLFKPQFVERGCGRCVASAPE